MSRFIPRLGLATTVIALMAVLAACASAATSDTSSAAASQPLAASPEPTATPAPTSAPTATPTPTSEPEPTWSPITEAAAWPARAGLRLLERDGALFVMGGRTPNQSDIPGDSQIWSDVWRSVDGGANWELILETDRDHWAPRAYFQAVDADDQFFVIGGQDYGLEPNPFCALFEQGLKPPPGLGIDPDAPCPEFLPTSQFFNDVWTSVDGITWEERTSAAPWEARAGLSAAVLGDYIYVLGGSQNDDSSIIGPGGPQRIYFNDVWRSADGADWEQMTDAAPWEPRAGAAVVVLDGFLYLLGGEDGFTCEPLPDCEPPYFNDVWRTANGTDWELVTAEAGWSPRPGHVCKLIDSATAGRQIVCFGGFGLIENPLDVWTSVDGAVWERLESAVWNAAMSSEGKYDFDAVAVAAGGGRPAAIITAGGDRETFDFADPDNYLRIDNDVWQFTLDS